MDWSKFALIVDLSELFSVVTNMARRSCVSMPAMAQLPSRRTNAAIVEAPQTLAPLIPDDVLGVI
jgi:hypothetical protein